MDDSAKAESGEKSDKDDTGGDAAMAKNVLEKQMIGRTTSINSFVQSKIEMRHFKVPGLPEEEEREVAVNVEEVTDGHGLQSHDSIFQRVRAKRIHHLKRIVANFDLRPHDAAEESNALTGDKKKIKRTCGMHLTFSLRFLLVVADVSLVIILSTILIAPTQSSWQNSLGQLYSEVQSGINGTRVTTAEVLGSLSMQMGFETLLNLQLLIQSNTVNLTMLHAQAVASVISTNRFLLESMNTSVAALYSGEPSFANSSDLDISWKRSIGPFILSVVDGGTVESLARLFLGWETNEFVGAFETDNRQNILFSYGPPSLSLPPVTKNTTKFFVENGIPNWSRINAVEAVDWVNRPWYRAQVETHNSTSMVAGAWSDVYQYVENDKAGVTFSWPLLQANNPEKLVGVIGVDIEMSILSEFCRKKLYDLVNSPFTPLLRPKNDSDLDGAVLYVVQNSAQSAQPGALLASSTFKSTGLVGGIHVVNNVSDPFIRVTARVISDHLPWGRPDIWKKYSTTPFHCIINLTAVTEDPDSVHCMLDNCRDQECLESNRMMLLASPIQSQNTTALPVAVPLELVCVLAIPSRLFLGKVSEQLRVSQELIDKTLKSSLDTANHTLLRMIGLAIGLCLLTVVLAVLLSLVVTRPLKILDKGMRQIKNLDFQAQSRYHSRINEIRKIQETFTAVKNSLQAFAKFVPKTVVYNIVHNLNKSRGQYVKEKVVTILFSDIADFTSISELLPDKDVLHLLTVYFTYMTKIIESYSGVIGEVLGDGILAFWNTPDDVSDHAALAVASALSQHEIVQTISKEFEETLRKWGYTKPLSIRIGIHTGKVLTGNVGSAEKLKWGCIGDPVNTASRLEGLCKLFGVQTVLSEDTVALLPEIFEVRELASVAVKGKQKALRLYEAIRMNSRFYFSSELEAKNHSAIMKSTHLSKKAQSKNADTSPQSPKKGKGGSASCCCWNSKSPSKRDSFYSSTSSSMEPGQLPYFDPLGNPPTETEMYDKQTYETALHLFEAGSFGEALETLHEMTELDGAGTLLQKRIEEACHRFGGKIEGEPEKEGAWTGVLDLKEKSF